MLQQNNYLFDFHFKIRIAIPDFNYSMLKNVAAFL